MTLGELIEQLKILEEKMGSNVEVLISAYDDDKDQEIQTDDIYFIESKWLEDQKRWSTDYDDPADLPEGKPGALLLGMEL